MMIYYRRDECLYRASDDLSKQGGVEESHVGIKKYSRDAHGICL